MGTSNIEKLTAGFDTSTMYRKPFAKARPAFCGSVRNLRDPNLKLAMIDIETEDENTPTAVISQISAVVFRPNGSAGELVDGNGVIIAPHIDIRIKRNSGDQPGRTRSANCHQWIDKLPEEVVESVWLGGDRVDLVDGIRALETFLRGQGVRGVIAQHNAFDISILRHASKDLMGRDFYFPFYVEFDCKTMESMIFGRNTRKEGEIHHFGDSHNAVHDCISQALMVQGCMHFINTIHSKSNNGMPMTRGG